MKLVKNFKKVECCHRSDRIHTCNWIFSQIMRHQLFFLVFLSFLWAAELCFFWFSSWFVCKSVSRKTEKKLQFFSFYVATKSQMKWDDDDVDVDGFQMDFWGMSLGAIWRVGGSRLVQSQQKIFEQFRFPATPETRYSPLTKIGRYDYCSIDVYTTYT